MRKRAIIAAFWSAVEQIGAVGLNTIFMMLFARMLTPTDFGVYASAALITGFGSKLALLGFDSVLVQREELTSEILNSAFCFSLAIAIFECGILALVLFVFPQIFSSDVAAIMPIMAFSMVVTTVTLLLTSTLRRDLKMKALARRTIFANILSGLIATPYIIAGFGVMGLVIQTVVGALITLLLTIRIMDWRIRPAFDAKKIKEIILFGLPVTGADLLTHYNRESPKIFVGMILGVEALGIMSMAVRLMNLIMNVVGTALTRVILPVIAKVRRVGGDVASAYLRMVRLASSIIFPVFLLCMVLSEQVIVLVLGDQWHTAASVLQFLCGAGVLTTLNYLNGSTIVAIGKPSARFWFSCVRTVVGSTLLLVATPYGVAAAGAAFFVRGIFVEPAQLIYLLRELSLKVGSYARSLKGAVLASSIALSVSIAILSYLPSSAIVQVLAVTIISAIVYLCVLYKAEREIFFEFKGLIGKR